MMLHECSLGFFISTKAARRDVKITRVYTLSLTQLEPMISRYGHMESRTIFFINEEQGHRCVTELKFKLKYQLHIMNLNETLVVQKIPEELENKSL